jgi:anti-sigma factor RsiW
VSTAPLTCKELVELVTDYFEGSLPPQDRGRFEEHMMSCPPCRAYLEQLRATMRLLGSIPEERVSPAAEEALVAALHNWKRE